MSHFLDNGSCITCEHSVALPTTISFLLFLLPLPLSLRLPLLPHLCHSLSFLPPLLILPPHLLSPSPFFVLLSPLFCRSSEEREEEHMREGRRKEDKRKREGKASSSSSSNTTSGSSTTARQNKVSSTDLSCFSRCC